MARNPCVSIPERVLGWLKRAGNITLQTWYDVSIPERVLGWLKPSDDIRRRRDFCVSIPERVLGWLKPYHLLLQVELPGRLLCFNP